MTSPWPSDPGIDIARLIAESRDRMSVIVSHEAGSALLRFETLDDLVQGAQQEALRSSDRFEWRGPEAFGGWLQQIVRRHLNGRRDHWFALKRNCGAVLRLTWQAEGRVGGGMRLDPADTATGPATFAYRREQLLLAAKAMALLLERDRQIIEWTTEGASMDELAGRLDVSLEAARKAQQRAVERLRKAFDLVGRGSS